MKIEEATFYLEKNHVNPFIFNIGRPKLAECFVIEKIDGIWTTYVWERGTKSSLIKFESEDNAVDSFVKEVISIARSSIDGFIE